MLFPYLTSLVASFLAGWLSRMIWEAWKAEEKGAESSGLANNPVDDLHRSV
jgi:hypothetical protein